MRGQEAPGLHSHPDPGASPRSPASLARAPRASRGCWGGTLLLALVATCGHGPVPAVPGHLRGGPAQSGFLQPRPCPDTPPPTRAAVSLACGSTARLTCRLWEGEQWEPELPRPCESGWSHGRRLGVHRRHRGIPPWPSQVLWPFLGVLALWGLLWALVSCLGG